MGTVSDKLIYLSDTKDAIADAIVAKGVTVSSNNTFREYAELIGQIDTEASLQEKTFTENGTYTADEGYDGFGEVEVNVQPELASLQATENGVYTPADGYYGFDEVEVVVEPSLETLNATENGIYEPAEGTDGFSVVAVNVPSSEPVLETLSASANGTYIPEEGVDGFSEVTVEVEVPRTNPFFADITGILNFFSIEEVQFVAFTEI